MKIEVVDNRIIVIDEVASLDEDLNDYKFYCFNGKPKYCQVIRNRHSNETIDFYDMNWRHQEFVGLNPNAHKAQTLVARPVFLDDMIRICYKISEKMKFSRIDLYVIDDTIYFGEITLYPAAGFGTFVPEKWDEKLGRFLNL